MKRLSILLTFFALLFIQQFSLATDLDDLKAADALGEKLTTSLDPKDIEPYANMFNEDFDYFDMNIPFPIKVTRDMILQSRAAEIAQMESSSWIQGNTIYRLIGDTGIVTKFGTLLVKPKGAPETINNVRFTLVFAKVQGKWLICAAHVSKMPLGQ